MPETVLSAVGIGKVRMIENVEELGAELGTQAFAEVPVLGHREIQVAEAGVREEIAPHGAERPYAGGIMTELPLA